MGRGSITLYIMIIAGMGIVLSGWWYRNIWFKVEETIEIYVNVFWICVCLLAALSIYGWRMHELLDTCNRTMENSKAAHTLKKCHHLHDTIFTV